MITPGLHPLCQLLSIYKFEILHHSILGNSDKRRDFDPTVNQIEYASATESSRLIDYVLILCSESLNIEGKDMAIECWNMPRMRS